MAALAINPLLVKAEIPNPAQATPAVLRAALLKWEHVTTPDSMEGRAVRYWLAMTPRALSQYLRRNSAEFLNPTRKNGPVGWAAN